MKKINVTFTLILFSLLLFSFTSRKCNEDLVPDEETALTIGNAILSKLYGKILLNYKPLFVKSKDTTWIVEGTLNSDVELGGGVPVIIINKRDSKVVNVYRTK